MGGWSPQPGQIPLSEMKKFGCKGSINTYYVCVCVCVKDSLPGGKQAAKLVSQSFCYLLYRTG